MANHRNTRGKYSLRQRRSNAAVSVLKTIGILMLAFLVIGLIGSLFAPRSDADEKPTDPPSPDESATDPVKPYTVTGGTVDGNGTVSLAAGQKAQIQFAGRSAAWELNGTVNRETTDKVLSFGFLIEVENGKSLEINATNFGFIFGNFWADQHTSDKYDYDRYAGYSPSLLNGKYHMENTVQAQFTRDALAIGEGKHKSMHFRAMIVDNVFYVWFGFKPDNLTLSWVIPLTEELVYNEAYHKDGNPWANPFKGFTEGSSYSITLFNNGGNPAGSFSDLTVKSGNKVDLSVLPAE